MPRKLLGWCALGALAMTFQSAPAMAEQAAATAPAPAPTPAAQATIEATPALWKVADEDTTIYLFGTVHVLPANYSWYKGVIAKALEGSDAVVTEIPADAAESDATRALFLQTATLPAGQTLSGLLSPEQKQQYDAALTKLGVPPAAFDQFKPWFASITLTMLPLMKEGFDPAHGVEKVIDTKAGPDKQRAALETVQYQLSLFDSMSQDEQVKFLMETVKDLDRAGEMMHAMLNEWAKGDAKQLAELMNAEMDDPAIAERLLYQRNRNWAKWVERRLDTPGTVFVAVGAGHLAGANSVQDYLDKDGVASSRVQ